MWPFCKRSNLLTKQENKILQWDRNSGWKNILYRNTCLPAMNSRVLLQVNCRYAIILRQIFLTLIKTMLVNSIIFNSSPHSILEQVNPEKRILWLQNGRMNSTITFYQACWDSNSGVCRRHNWSRLPQVLAWSSMLSL